MKYITKEEIISFQEEIITETGGSFGIRYMEGIDSSASQPMMTFGGNDLYPSLSEKASALCYSLAMNHCFVDGNKRIAYMAMEAFLMFNGFELNVNTCNAKEKMLMLASGNLTRNELTYWINNNIEQKTISTT